ncbi:hypothetical protein VIGAN_10087800, partial [Vigna angularis var. angularis]
HTPTVKPDTTRNHHFLYNSCFTALSSRILQSPPLTTASHHDHFIHQPLHDTTKNPSSSHSHYYLSITIVSVSHQLSPPAIVSATNIPFELSFLFLPL